MTITKLAFLAVLALGSVPAAHAQSLADPLAPSYGQMMYRYGDSAYDQGYRAGYNGNASINNSNLDYNLGAGAGRADYSINQMEELYRATTGERDRAQLEQSRREFDAIMNPYR